MQAHDRAMAERSAEGLYAWLAAVPARDRDAAIEEHLGIDAHVSTEPPGDDLIGHHMTGVAAIVRALHEVPVRAEDVVIDLGSGLGKILLLVRLLTGATVHGIELQPALVEAARIAAERAGIEGTFVCEDARAADLSHGTVFFLYAPFTGPVLEKVCRRLDAVAARHPIVVCALGIDLDRYVKRLSRRADSSFWATIWDSDAPRAPLAPTGAALTVAEES